MSELLILRYATIILLVGLGAAPLSFIGCRSAEVFDGNENHAVFPQQEWSQSSPQEQGLDLSRVTRALGYLAGSSGGDQLDETIIVKNGYIVFQGDSTHRRHNVYSCTKSLVSAAAGLLRDDGVLELTDKAAAYEPLLAELYPAVTLRHFMTMTSGYSAEGNSRWGEPSADWSPTPYVPAEPLFAPGTQFAYWDEAQMMFGSVLARIAERDLYELLDERIMRPIGVKDWDWWHEDSLTLASGRQIPRRNGCTGIELNAEDFARIGWLFANHGLWNGDTLLSPEFTQAAMRAQVPQSIPIAQTDRYQVVGNGVYGFNWWTASPDGKGEHRMPNSPADAAYMSGYNHNVCLVVPSEQLVIVRMGEDGNPRIGKWQTYDNVLKYLLTDAGEDG